MDGKKMKKFNPNARRPGTKKPGKVLAALMPGFLKVTEQNVGYTIAGVRSSKI
jgi:hypothetical protein